MVPDWKQVDNQIQITNPNQTRQNEGSWIENKQQGLMMEDFQADSGDEVVILTKSVEKK